MKRSNVILLVVISVCLLCIAVVVAIGVWARGRSETPGAQEQQIVEEAESRRCQQRLTQIGDAIVNYAGAHGGALPDSLAPLAVAAVCPKTGEQYLYLGKGYSSQTAAPGEAARYVLAYEPSASHFGRHWFLMADGHVEIPSAEAGDAMVAALKAGKNPPR